MSNAYPPGQGGPWGPQQQGPYGQNPYQPQAYGPQGYGPPQYAQAPFVFAGFWWRVLAYLIDGIVLSIPVWGLIAAVIIPMIPPEAIIQVAPGSYTVDPARLPPGVLTALFSFYGGLIVAVWLYFAVLESSSWQGTVGKKVLGIRVTDYHGQRIGFGRATGRFFSKILSAMTLYIGFLMIGFTARKQGLHDMIASTFCVRRA